LKFPAKPSGESFRRKLPAKVSGETFRRKLPAKASEPRVKIHFTRQKTLRLPKNQFFLFKKVFCRISAGFWQYL
jgi:hypothetical protein